MGVLQLLGHTGDIARINALAPRRGTDLAVLSQQQQADGHDPAFLLRRQCCGIEITQD
jgi:hypothetical protein